MKKALLAIGLLTLALTLSSCQIFKRIGFDSNQFMITGEVITVEQDTPADVEAGTSKKMDPIPPAPTMTIAVSHDIEDEDGNVVETVELASGEFVDGKVLLTGRVTEPSLATITVTVEGDDTPYTTTTMVTPDADLKFALYERSGRKFVYLKGKMMKSSDADNKFTLAADLSTMDLPDNPQVMLSGFGYVLVDDGMIYIEGDAANPRSASFYIFGSDRLQSAQLILEAGVNYTVEPMGSEGAFAIASDQDGLHTQLINSWRLDPEYIKASTQYDVAYAEFLAEREAEQAAAAEAAGEEAEEEVDETPPELPNLTFAENNPAAPECQHVDLTAVMRGIGLSPPPGEQPDYMQFANQMTDIKSRVLQKIVFESTDQDVAWMALSTGAFGRDSMEEELQALHDMADRFDSKFVEEKVAPRIKTQEQRVRTANNNKTLVPGQAAPQFTLANLDGDEVSLFDVLQENEMVLIDFWASWCGPCIASFPALKEMYAGYQEDGFEIVAVSIDSTFEAWEKGFNDHELPWINLGATDEEGEMVGWSAPTAVMYGVNFIPKGFLLDSEGCIVQKDLPTSKLERVLTARWGELPEPEADDSES